MLPGVDVRHLISPDTSTLSLASLRHSSHALIKTSHFVTIMRWVIIQFSQCHQAAWQMGSSHRTGWRYWPIRGLQCPPWPIRGLGIVPGVCPSGLFTSGPEHCPQLQLGWRQELYDTDSPDWLHPDTGWHFLENDSPPRVAQYFKYSPKYPNVIWEENLSKIFYKSERNLLIRNLLSRVSCLKIRLEIFVFKIWANIFQIIFENFRNNADTQHFFVLKGYLRFSRHFLVDTLI